MGLAILLSLLAGLATSIGGLLALHKKVLERPFLSSAMAFAAGVMLFVSFVEIIPLGIAAMQAAHDDKTARWWVYGAFFAGIVLVALIDKVLPKSLNPNEIEGKENEQTPVDRRKNERLLRSGLLVALVLALHNFPEGMSTFFATYQDAAAGAVLAIAIAIHNIPEGIAVAAPVYAATGSRKKAFWWATLSGLAEPIGALAAFGLVSIFIPDYLFGIMFGLIAGMMVFIAIDELLPGARRYQTDKHQVVYGLLAGMVIVALSLLLI